MCGFHCTRSSTANHQFTLLSQRFAYLGNLAIVNVSSQHAVSAHHTDDVRFPIVVEEVMKRIANGVVVQGASQGFLYVRRLFTTF